MRKLFNHICLLGAGTFSYQLMQDINCFKYNVVFNKKRIYWSSFSTIDSRELKADKNKLYLLTVAKSEVKEKIFKEHNELSYIDVLSIESSISKKIEYQKNLVIWKSFIGDMVSFGNNIYIGPYSIIAKNVKINDNVSIYPRVSILKGSKIGKNCSIGTNSVITDGCEIGENTIIGPNITIYENIPSNSIIIK